MNPQLDIAWILICAAMVMLMQAGFSCLESGLVRTKNSINVATKNFVDFCVSSTIFWLFGFALMFGASISGLFGTSDFLFDPVGKPWLAAFFVFQMGFCGTATTIISGAVAERMRFAGYLVVAIVVSALIYPVMGHWVWASASGMSSPGWLEQIGFIDFAGSTVVHSVGGWVSLAAIIIIGPRLGRFSDKKPPIQGHDLPVAALGVFLLWFGWFGFNGGSTLGLTAEVPLIILNTMISGAFGGLTSLVLSWRLTGRPDVGLTMNGGLAGLVGITALAHIVNPGAAMIVGCVAALIMYGVTQLLEKFKLDDVVGAVPVHLGAGIWGTLAVALFGDPLSWGGHGRLEQLAIQATGVGVCFAWAFGVGFALLWLINRRLLPLRIGGKSERIGLNVAEHGASTDTINLLTAMKRQQRSSRFSRHVAVEPHTEIGQIADQYNQVLNDIEAVQVKREAESRQARETLEDAIESLDDGFVLYDAADNFIMCNQSYRELNQTSLDKLQPGVSWEEFIRTGAERGQYAKVPDGPEAYVETFSRRRHHLLAGEKNEFQLTDGRWVVSENSRTRQGGMVGISFDITQQKELENSLRESEALIRRVLEACPIPVGMYRLEDGFAIYESPHAKALFGRDPAAQMVPARNDFVDPMERDSYLALIRQTGLVEAMEVQLQKADGSTIWAAISAQLIDFQGQEAVVAATLDLTERNEMELEMDRQREALHQSEKLSALGELLAGVAHELNNPLSVVVGQSVLLEETASDARVLDRAQRIGTAANRCARIVKTFLAMAKQQPMERKAVDMNDIIESAIEVTGYALRSASIEADVALAANLPEVWGDDNLLNQVLTNLVINAQQAMSGQPGPRRLEISTSYSVQDSFVTIVVSDNGPGVPDEIRERIFEPFFTTKEIGTGIGLAACQRIVESHRGNISLASSPHGGTRFTVSLPLARNTEIDADEAVAEVFEMPAPLSILVVDDETEVADMLSQILTGDRHHVDIAHRGSIALELLCVNDYDVILSDLRMHEMDGEDFYKALQRDPRGLLSRLAFVTGDTVSPMAQRFLKSANCPYIEKPVMPKELRDLVHRVSRDNLSTQTETRTLQ